ncbi:MAG: acyl carrier protein [Clostridia bacterium]|nr:acyl carrier protein [Clostridia bacterium]
MYEELKEMLVNELLINPDDITLEAELANDLGISSVDLADLICNCEEKFGIEIDDTDMTRFVTVGDVVAYLEEKKK